MSTTNGNDKTDPERDAQIAELMALYKAKGEILRRVRGIKIPHVRTDRGFRHKRATQNERGFSFWATAQIVVLVLATLVPTVTREDRDVEVDPFSDLRAKALHLRGADI